jgi:hypothetical protein
MLKPNGGGSIHDTIQRMDRERAINAATQRLLLIDDPEKDRQ